ncbi:serine hydrolase [Sulfitobacter sp. F26169L]|uniref:serine hydrolase n=1 Tax=Sulfitobacter sp. F26169L TaxID=2996015 RepID=UPI002260FF6E|nr:serine hydrolase [Sulfitobacter sp. F26169L]MCX7564990.1 serine hydrolase [Sulfitobacter sp. F26169L]
MNKLITAAVAATVTIAGAAMAQEKPLDAKASNPVTLGWMQGFPPPPDKTIRYTDPDFFAFPKLRWTVCNFRQLMPNVAVPNAAGSVSTLPADPDAGIDAVEFNVLNSDEVMTFDAAFNANYTDGLLILHHGRIVYERYDGCLDENTLHGAMSVTKSITGLMAEVLVAEGRLDETALMADIIPELEGSAFADATVAQVLEMTTALDYSEDYSDPDAEVWTYSQAGSTLPKPEGYDGPRSYFDYLATVQKNGDKHGEAFGYKTVNADAAGWLVARTAGKSAAQYLSDRIWSRIGTEREAFYTVDSIGTPFSGGGFNATLRDMGRLGQLILQNGEWNGEQVIPAAAIERIRQGGNPAAFAKAGYDLLPDWSYSGLWWVSHNDHGAFAARGVHGQTIWVDPTADMVIVRFASNPVAGNAASDPTSLPAYQAVAEYLMEQDATPQLAGREWLIEDIAGKGVIDRSPASLQFLPDGSLAGNTTCNRLIGTYEQTEEGLSLNLTGTTMMACPPAMANQEQHLTQLLPKVVSAAFDENATLTLTTSDGETIIARRR